MVPLSWQLFPPVHMDFTWCESAGESVDVRLGLSVDVSV